MKRTHHCGELRAAQVGQKVTLTGWVHVRRDLGGIVFIELRDRGGNTQVVFDPQHNKPSWELAQSLRSEFVVAVEGAVRQRPAGTENPKMATGEVEVLVHHLEILNPSETPPFQIDESGGAQAGEDLRLQYRYLDLRRPAMARNLVLRHRTAKAVRDYFDSNGFLEVETPILFKSTPEGAREYLVPSRVNPGKFYALPQSPQQFKQMLMVAGVDRYFQIAKCFRDEDLRADRQPEFTQIDVEMSFITREDMYAIIEGLLAAVWLAARGEKIPTPFPRMPFIEAMERFGSDKPDTRFRNRVDRFHEGVRPEPIQGVSRRRGLRWSRQGHQREGTRQRDTRPDRIVDGDGKEFRREGAGLHQGRGRRVEIADCEILQRCREEGARREVEDRRGRPDFVRRGQA